MKKINRIGKMEIDKRKYFLMLACSAMIFGGVAKAQNVAKSAESVPQKIESDVKKAYVKFSEDFKKSYEDAKKEGKVLMLHFTGSDWCPSCMMLHKFVLDTEKFAGYAEKNVKAVVADFTRDGNPKSSEFGKLHRQLAEQYGITGFPTLIFIDPQTGRTGMLVGFETQTPDELITVVENFKKQSAEKSKNKNAVDNTPAN